MKEYFDRDHYSKVYRARKEAGLPTKEYHNIEIKNSIYKGRKLLNKETGKIYTIEKVNQQWYHGYYVGLLIENNGSHCFIFWLNMTLHDEFMLDCIAKTREKYELIPQ